MNKYKNNIIPEILPAKSDFIFKMIFGDEKNKDILAGFLKSLLDLPDEEYTILEIKDPQIKKTLFDDKLSVLDVKVETKNKKIIDIEIQLSDTKEMTERMLYYLSRLITDQVNSGDDYIKIQKTIGILITEFKLFEHSFYFDKYKLYSKETGTKFTDLLEIVTFEITKLPKNEDGSIKYNWGKFLTVDNKEDLEMISQTDPLIKKASKILETISYDETTRADYEARRKAILAHNSGLRYEREEGIKEGTKKGKIEGKVEIARSLLIDGLDINFISKHAKLSIEELKKIKDNLK